MRKLHDFRCSDCGNVTEALVGDNESPRQCPNCGRAGMLSRIISGTNFMLKGKDWFNGGGLNGKGRTHGS